MSQDLFEIMRSTRSMRRLKPDPVPDALLRQVLEAGTCAANGGNMQSWRFLVIRDPAIKAAAGAWYTQGLARDRRTALSLERAGTRDHPRTLREDAGGGGIPGRSFPRGTGLDRALRARTQEHRIVGVSGRAEHPSRLSRSRPRRHADHTSSELREGSRGGDGVAGRRAFLCDPADRISNGEVRTGPARVLGERGVSGSLGRGLSGRLNQASAERI